MDKPLQSISFYESRSVILISGLCLESKKYTVLEIKRSIEPCEVRHEMALHSEQYTATEVKDLAVSLKCSAVISDAFIIFGIVRLVESSYIIVVTKARCVATIHGHRIYTIAETSLIPITYKVRNTMEESRYKSILQNLSLSNNSFYFSYAVDLTNSLQQNFTSKHKSDKSLNESVRGNFVWNSFALSSFLNYNMNRKQNNRMQTREEMSEKTVHMDRWIIPVIHGFLKQKNFGLLGGTTFKYTLIARRSRLYAGTRYLRRGVDTNGFTANEVETEQIVTKELDIKIMEKDYGYKAAFKHFNMLIENYGNNITVLNLVRLHNSNREMTVGSAFEELISALNKHYEGIYEIRESQIADIDSIKDKDNDSDDIYEYDSEDSSENPNPNFEKKIIIKNNNDNISATEVTRIKYIDYDFHGSPHSALFTKLESLSQEVLPNSGFFVQPPHNYKGEDDGLLTQKDKGSQQYVSWPLDSDSAKIMDMDGSLQGLLGLSSSKSYSPVQTDAQNVTTPNASYPEKDDYKKGYLKGILGQKDSKENSNTMKNEVPVVETAAEEKEETGLGSGVCQGLLQKGVLRTNCIDCLDRTNVAQFCYARHALPLQLKSLGAELSAHHMHLLDTICTEIWAEHGDVLAQQYGGSGAMHSISSSSSNNKNSSSTTSHSSSVTSHINRSEDDNDSVSIKPAPSSMITGWGVSQTAQEGEREFHLSGGTKNAIVAVQRYYSNVSSDFERQQSIDLLLGVFEPSRGKIPIWDLDMNIPTTQRGLNKQKSSSGDSKTNGSNDSNENNFNNGLSNTNNNDYYDYGNIKERMKKTNGADDYGRIGIKKNGKPHISSRDFDFHEDDYQQLHVLTDLSEIANSPHNAIVLDNIGYKPYPRSIYDLKKIPILPSPVSSASSTQKKSFISSSYQQFTSDYSILTDYSIAPIELESDSPARGEAFYRQYAFPSQTVSGEVYQSNKEENQQPSTTFYLDNLQSDPSSFSSASVNSSNLEASITQSNEINIDSTWHSSKNSNISKPSDDGNMAFSNGFVSFPRYGSHTPHISPSKTFEFLDNKDEEEDSYEKKIKEPSALDNKIGSQGTISNTVKGSGVTESVKWLLFGSGS